MLLNVAKKCHFNTFATSMLCRCVIQKANQPCQCLPVSARFISGGKNSDSKLSPEEEESSTNSSNSQQTDSQPTNMSHNSVSGPKNRTYIEVNLFGPKDARAPFPGNLGISPAKYDKLRAPPTPTIQQFQLIQQHGQNHNQNMTTTIERQMSTFETMSDRHCKVIEMLNSNRSLHMELKNMFDPIKSHLDIRVFDCPKLVSDDLKQVFNFKGLDQLQLIMITINFVKSSVPFPIDLENQTTQFLAQFCEMLLLSGFWCNYIASEVTSINMEHNWFSAKTIEMYERYRRNAFKVNNQDNCSVIQYSSDQSDQFYGSIFTNATFDAQPLQIILDKLIDN